MTQTQPDAPRDVPAPERDDMAHFGITRVRVDQFHYKSFRYSRLADAVAEAKRDETRLGQTSAGLRSAWRRTLRHGPLTVWREARRANLSFPQQRDNTQAQMAEQQRLEREQETARVKLAEFDAAQPRQAPETEQAPETKQETHEG